MPGFFGKKQRKQDTAAKTQEAMGLANAIGQYNMANRTDDDVRGTFQRLGPEEKSGFAKGLFAERGAQDPMATEIGRQAGGVGGLDILAFTPADFRRLGGKPGFKFRGLTQYAMIERAFLACYEMPEETQRQIDAKRAAYFGLQEMCQHWHDKHNLSEGGSGGESEARKGHAVMRLYVHTQAKSRQLSFLRRSAPSEADLERNRIESYYQANVARSFTPSQPQKMFDQRWHSHAVGQNRDSDLNMVRESARSTMEEARASKIKLGGAADNNIDFDIIRGTSDASRSLGSVGAQAAARHVWQNCYNPTISHFKLWKACAADTANLAIVSQDSSLTTYSIPPDMIKNALNELLAGLFSDIPDDVLEVCAAHMQGMADFNITDKNNQAMNKAYLAANALTLRLFTPCLTAILNAALQEVAPEDMERSEGTMFTSCRTVMAAVQSAFNNQPSNSSDPTRQEVTEYLRGKLATFTGDLGNQILGFMGRGA